MKRRKAGQTQVVVELVPTFLLTKPPQHTSPLSLSLFLSLSLIFSLTVLHVFFSSSFVSFYSPRGPRLLQSLTCINDKWSLDKGKIHTEHHSLCNFSYWPTWVQCWSIFSMRVYFESIRCKNKYPEADSLNIKVLELQRQVIKARPHKNVNKSFQLSHAPWLLWPASAISELYFLKNWPLVHVQAVSWLEATSPDLLWGPLHKKIMWWDSSSCFFV